MSNKHVLKGMSQLVNAQNVKSGLNYEDIERKMLATGVIEQPKDPTESFKSALNDLAKNLQLNFETPKAAMPTPRSTTAERPAVDRGTAHRLSTPRSAMTERSATARMSTDHMSTNRMSTDHMSTDHMSTDLMSPPRVSTVRSSPRVETNDTPTRIESESSSEDSGDDTPQRPAPERSYTSTPRMPTLSSPAPRTEFERRTREQEHHAQIRSMIRESGDDPDDDTFTVEKEKMEDAKTSMLVEIDSLWSDLEEENVNLERIPRPTQNSSYETVENVLKTLRMKLDRARYCSLADDVVLAGAGIIEDIFDGKRVFFNRYCPDMTGWSKSVQMKLRRMKHDTSSIVGNVMSENNIGPGTRIALELVPNAFMHARSKRAQFGKETIYSDAQLQQSIHNLRNIEEN